MLQRRLSFLSSLNVFQENKYLSAGRCRSTFSLFSFFKDSRDCVAMKSVFMVLFIFGSISQAFAVSQPIIRNTRAEGCVDGVCASHCAWDGVKIFPGDQLNQPGKCNLLRCSKNFDIFITPCPFDSKNVIHIRL